MLLFAIFVIIPLTEVALFVIAGGALGVFNTLALCVLTAIAGSFLLRQQGLATLFKVKAAMERGEMPVAELFDGFCIGIAGVLLLVPGFFTDIIGFSLMEPRFRTWLRKRLAAHFEVKFNTAEGGSPRDPYVIEAEYERVDEQDKP